MIGLVRNKSHNVKRYKKYKNQARRIIVERVEFYNKHYGFTYNRIAIRNQKTKWGSCSNKMNLNYNYKIIFLPQALFDYIIVHELCHLKELNHSKAYWALVSETIPDYKHLNKILKEKSFTKL